MTGYQLIGTDDGDVTIYGDPEGLRCLAKLLLFVADLDQSKLQNNMPADDSFHCQVSPGFREKLPSLRLRVGRVDNRVGEFRSDVFPSPERKN